MRRRKLRLVKQSEDVRRDDVLRTSRNQLRRTDHWCLIDDRRRRVFQQICDDVRRERLDASVISPSESDASSLVVTTRTKHTDEGLTAVSGISSSSLMATATTSVLCVSVKDGLMCSQHEASTRSTGVTLRTTNSTSGTHQTVATTTSLSVTTVGCSVMTEDLCVVVTSTSMTAADQPCITVSTTAAATAAVSGACAPSSAPRGRVTFSERHAEIPTVNGVVDNKDVSDDCSSMVQASTSSEVPPSLRSFGNNETGDENDSAATIRNSTCSAAHIGGAKVNIPSAKKLINGGESKLERVSRPASSTLPHERPGSASSNGVAVTRVSRVPPPVPTRTSSVLTAARSAKSRPTLPPSAISNSLSHQSVFSRNRSSPAPVSDSEAEVLVETEIN